MSADLTANVSDSSVKEFLGAFIEHPFLIFSLMFLVWFGMLLYKERIFFFEIIKSYFSSFGGRRKITKIDLTQHQIFKDLDYWIDYRVNQLYGSILTGSYDKAKIAMARAILLIKLRDTKSWLSCFVNETNFEDSSSDIRSIFHYKKEKHNAIQWAAYKERGIPSRFIEKFMEVSRIHESYLVRSCDDLLSERVPMNIYEKVYMLLGFLTVYYSTLIIEIGRVIESINGDLKGEVFDNMVVGGNDYRCYPVPNRDFIPLVETKLNEVILSTKASRASIFVIHDVPSDDYLQGCISRVYEYEVKGFLPVMSHFQYKPAICLTDMVSTWKQHQGFHGNVSELNDLLKEMLITIGVEAIFTYPMFVGGKLKGFLALEYSSIDTYNNLNIEKVSEIIKKYASILNVYIDYSKTGLNYEGNSMREVREDRG